ncbi:MAG: hypothetical protein INR62_06430 [Rhodospirillales bacterium]|nr:hypothetical protein [Acetobacter sp.]
MKAQLRIVKTELPLARIKPLGGAGQGSIGHQFDLLPFVKVDKRSMGMLSGEGIEFPRLEWKERIEWFSAEVPKMVIGARGGTGPIIPNKWTYVGDNTKDMYAENPTSNTFKAWHSMKFVWACYGPPNSPPAGLKDCLKSADSDKAAKHWIAGNGHQWQIPELTDRPAMGLAGGSGGGGGASLVTTNTRRRVIYFDLGFSGYATRLKCVQVLESVNGVATIHKFIAQDVTKAQVDDPANLARWRSQVNSPTNVQF